MKNLILVFAAIAISAGAYAQTDSINRKMSLRDMNNQNLQNDPVDKSHSDAVTDSINKKTSMRDMNNNQNQNVQNNLVDNSHPDGVMMQNGKMMKVENGHMTILDHDMTMSNGTKIMSDGTCIKKDGTKKTMKEGQHMDMSGNMVSMKINKDKNMYLVPDSTKKK